MTNADAALATLLTQLLGPYDLDTLIETGFTARMEHTVDDDGRDRYWLVDIGDFRVSWYDEEVAKEALTLYRRSQTAIMESSDAFLEVIEATAEFIERYPPIEHGV